MAFGILEDRHYPDGNVPGTALLDDHEHTGVRDEVVDGLKKGSGRYSHIVLVPQPSDDPNDPLNWPRWKKEAIFWTLSFMAGLVGAIGPLLAPGYSVLAAEWGVSVNEVAATNGDLVIALGCIMIVQAPLGVKFGRRPVFLVGAALLFFCTIWSAESKNITSFKWSRVFQGLGMAPFEALVVSTIGDIFFVHERGFRSAIWGFAILAGINITPIVNGYVIESDKLGYRWCFWLIAIFLGIAFLGIIFLCPETAYNRESIYDTSSGRSLEGVSAVNKASEELEKENSHEPKPTGQIEHLEGGPRAINSFGPRKTWVQELAPISSYRGKASLLKTIIRPFPFFLSPAVWFGIFTYGMTTCWLVVLSIISSILFASPPYFFNASQTGLVSIGPLVASIPATLIAGPLCDMSATYFARRNGGRFEPEFRLFLMLPMFILEVFGFMGWSLMTKNQSIPWIGPVFMYSLINAGQSIGSTCIITYLIDVHSKHTPEAISIINLFKNLVLYGFTQFAVNWVLEQGIPGTMGVLAGLSAVCILTTVPMYIYGKRIRSYVARHEKLYLAVDEKL
ncbi:serine/threonine kinase 16 [Leucosporidium creatinivorum]|uniref:Serine/threonine kinase 16 n=1 Tax=Leucosporidium creatinivorum TaxID=106004 RepID=A0A1Y2G320_9BASI|nr:serine/threonine kinase 16 [Leucosporidium creatinivorum]